MPEEFHFLADVHLPRENSVRTRVFQSYLDGLQGSRVSRVYLLGDIFDAWYHRSTSLRTRYGDVLSALARCAQRGVELHFCPGNRDFLFGEGGDARYFPFVKIHSGGTRFRSGKRSFYCSHGDELCAREWGDRLWRFFARSRPLRSVFGRLPEAFKSWFVMTISREVIPSESACSHDVAPGVYEALGADTIVHGHFHRSGTLKVPESGIVVQLLPDWVTSPTVLVYNVADQEFHVRRFESDT